MLALLICCAAYADDRAGIRTPGFKAVMNVYWIDRSNLDIVAESSYWFPTGKACRDAMPKAMAIATGAAASRDDVLIECKAFAHLPATRLMTPEGST